MAAVSTIPAGTSGKIDDMKMTWPLASVIMGALSAVVATQIWGDGSTQDILLIVLTVLSGLNLAEQREIKANGNGAMSRLMEENANYRRQLADITNRALESPPLSAPIPPER